MQSIFMFCAICCVMKVGSQKFYGNRQYGS